MQEEKSQWTIIFSQRLKTSLKGHKQREIADEIGVGQPALSGYANGKLIPSLETFRALCQALGASADWLLGLAEEQSGAGSVTVTATGGSAASGTGNATVNAAPPPPASIPPPDATRYLSIIESQQRVIESLTRPAKPQVSDNGNKE